MRADPEVAAGLRACCVRAPETAGTEACRYVLTHAGFRPF